MSAFSKKVVERAQILEFQGKMMFCQGKKKSLSNNLAGKWVARGNRERRQESLKWRWGSVSLLGHRGGAYGVVGMRGEGRQQALHHGGGREGDGGHGLQGLGGASPRDGWADRPPPRRNKRYGPDAP